MKGGVIKGIVKALGCLARQKDLFIRPRAAFKTRTGRAVAGLGSLMHSLTPTNTGKVTLWNQQLKNTRKIMLYE